MPLLIIKVECADGHDSTRVSHVDYDTLDYLNPLILEIKRRDGYFPTGDWLIDGKMTRPSIVYSNWTGEYDLLDRYLPLPEIGFKKIEEFIVVPDDSSWINLKM